MKLVDMLSINAAGLGGHSVMDARHWRLPVDAFVHENLIYLYQGTDGRLDYRHDSQLGIGFVFSLVFCWKWVGKLSCTYRIIKYMITTDTWRLWGE